MADDEWRIRIDVEEEEHATGLLDRLAGDLGSEARELARDLESRRLAVSRDGETIFVYAPSRLQARRAQTVVEAELEEAGIKPLVVRIEHWLADEERWDDEAPGETWEDDVVEHGYAPWEVRVEAARDLAEQLETEGYKPERRFHYLIVGVASREDADALAARLHGEVEAGGEVVLEAEPFNPFAIFGGLAQ